MTPERESQIHEEEFARFLKAVGLLAVFIFVLGLIVKTCESIYQHGYQARVEDEKNYEVMRNTCIDWAHENQANANMIRAALK